jgi:hypothetical protein
MSAKPLERLQECGGARRKELWSRSRWPGVADTANYWTTLLGGIPGFFEPNPLAFFARHIRLRRGCRRHIRPHRLKRPSTSSSTSH